ncbi:hypothetical protein ABT224_36145 [Streptomyces sp. NPDC001584]|uniref:hypothetical protein n=1 Tax=Streptomyces sp. NPDC001584 TaxID=3154521 RepID=UPI00333387BB
MTDTQERTARDLLSEALQAEGHTIGGESWLGSGCFVLTVQVTGPAQLWISDADAKLDYPPTEHTGWTAFYKSRGLATEEDAPEVYRSTDTDCAADTANLVRAVTAYVAAATA